MVRYNLTPCDKNFKYGISTMLQRTDDNKILLIEIYENKHDKLLYNIISRDSR
jgi:hypothetical protein